MIIAGVTEVDEHVYEFTQDAAQELINELQRAMAEAKDHQMNFQFEIVTYVNKRYSSNFIIAVKKD